MRLSTHLLTSALTGLTIYPRSLHDAALVTLAGVIVDLDHYVLYALRSGDWNPIGALRYNKRRRRPPRLGDTRPRYGPLRSVLHRTRLVVPLACLIGLGWPKLRPWAIGISLHLLLDTPLWLMMDWRVWRRARGGCERCGARRVPLGIYHLRRPMHGGAPWALHNRVAWCGQCAREARKNDYH